MAGSILLGRLRPAVQVEIAMSESISPKKGWVITWEAFDRMQAGLHPDNEQAGEQSHCFYIIIDAVSGCLYPQPRYILPSPLRRTLQTTKLAKQSKSLLREVFGG